MRGLLNICDMIVVCTLIVLKYGSIVKYQLFSPNIFTFQIGYLVTDISEKKNTPVLNLVLSHSLNLLENNSTPATITLFKVHAPNGTFYFGRWISLCYCMECHNHQLFRISAIVCPVKTRRNSREIWQSRTKTNH